MDIFLLLSDNILQHGAMATLITDGGKCEVSKKVTDILCTLFISQYDSELYHQLQNKSENHYAVIKHYTNTIMNLSGCPPLPPSCWLMHVICLMSLHLPLLVASPLQALTGQVPDISFLLHSTFWGPVYYKVDQSEPDSCFPSHSNEKRSHWAGFAEDKWDQFTWKILTDDTQKVLIQSCVCSATRTSTNKRLTLQHGEGQKTDVTSNSSVHDAALPHEDSGLMPTLNFDDLLGRPFLLPAQENGECK